MFNPQLIKLSMSICDGSSGNSDNRIKDSNPRHGRVFSKCSPLSEVAPVAATVN